MDILRFINSKDIRNHLKGINYQFNTLEAACRDAKLFDERLLKKNLEMYFDLGGCNSILAENILSYQTPGKGNCTDGLTENIFEMLSNLPTVEQNEDYYDGGLDDIELDKIIEKMRAHGLKITKAQLLHCRNEYDNQEHNQGLDKL